MAAQTDSPKVFAILATKAKMHAKAEESGSASSTLITRTALLYIISRTPNQLWENSTLP